MEALVSMMETPSQLIKLCISAWQFGVSGIVISWRSAVLSK